MKRNITLIVLSLISFASFAQLNLSYVGNITYNEELSDIWGYVAPDSTEYGIVGAFNGVSIVSLDDPTTPTEVAYVNGASSTWRDVKTWENFAYVINETANGIAVIDLSTLPDSVTAYDWAPNIPGFGNLSSCHNIYIDEFGFAYITGCNLNSGGILILNVDTPTGEPEFVSAMPAVYSHDVFVRNNLAYSSEINIGQFTIYDVSDKQNVIVLGEQNTPFNFAHNTWPSDDDQILFTTDELANAPVASYDISDPSNIQELDQFVPYETLGDGVIPHNVHVWNDFLIISYYSDGCILVDGSRPENLVEVGNFDTYIPANTGFNGAWGAYPFLPSGLVLVSDIGNGMYVLEPNYVRACWLEGNITNSLDASPIDDASIEILTTNVLESSDITGLYKTGFATAGTYDVRVSKAGFEPFVGQAVLENDVVTIFNAALTPLPSFALSGNVVDAADGSPIPDALVSISNPDFTFEVQADANGSFAIPTFFEGSYNAYAGKWGYSTEEVLDANLDENNANLTIEINQGYQDPFQLDLGWEVEAAPFVGTLERAVPFGILIPQLGYYINAENDISDDVGNQCYVTDNGPDPNQNVLFAGNTELTSPSFDLSTYNEPMISYSTLVYSINFANQTTITAGSGDIEVSLDNGFEEILLETLDYSGDVLTDAPDWVYSEINVLDFIGANPDSLSDLTINFNVSSFSNQEFTEAAIDDFVVWDANPTSAEELLVTQQFEANPNPSNTNFSIQYELESLDSNTRLLVYNTLGQLVHSTRLNDQLGTVSFGEELEVGVYFAHIIQAETPSRTIRLVKQ